MPRRKGLSGECSAQFHVSDSLLSDKRKIANKDNEPKPEVLQ